MAIDRKAELGNSIYFENPEEIDDIFIVPENEKMLYYVWMEEKGTYEKRDMTEEGLEAYKREQNFLSQERRRSILWILRKAGEISW